MLTLFNPRWWMLKKRFSIGHPGPFAEVNTNGYVIAIVSRGEQVWRVVKLRGNLIPRFHGINELNI